MTCEKRHPIWIFSPIRKSCREQKVLTLLFFSLSKQHRNPSQNRKKKHHTEKKKTGHFIFARALVVAKEKRDERDARKSSFLLLVSFYRAGKMSCFI